MDEFAFPVLGRSQRAFLQPLLSALQEAAGPDSAVPADLDEALSRLVEPAGSDAASRVLAAGRSALQLLCGPLRSGARYLLATTHGLLAAAAGCAERTVGRLAAAWRVDRDSPQQLVAHAKRAGEGALIAGSGLVLSQQAGPAAATPGHLGVLLSPMAGWRVGFPDEVGSDFGPAAALRELLATSGDLLGEDAAGLCSALVLALVSLCPARLRPALEACASALHARTQALVEAGDAYLDLASLELSLRRLAEAASCWSRPAWPPGSGVRFPSG